MLSVVGLVLYGILRLAYLFFYLQLRTTPEEVGYGYSQVLSESVVGALELTMLVALLFALLSLMFYGGRQLIEKARMSARRSSTKPSRTGSEDRIHVVRSIIIRCVAVSLVFVLLSMPGLAWWQGGLAKDGQTVRNVYFIGIPYLPVLAVQAVPARVAWVDNSSNRQLDLSKRDCLMYLGKANDVTVFYDVQSRESIRLPSSAIIVSLRYTFFVPPGCS